MQPQTGPAGAPTDQEVAASPTTILDDRPADKDALDFTPYVDTLADIITSPSTRTPLTIGIFGTWGSGKTSLMGMVRDKLPKGSRVAWFDAWKYAREETLWRALLLQVLATLRTALPKDDSDPAKKALAELDDLQTTLYRPVDREEIGQVTVDWDQLVKGSLLGMTHLTITLLPGLGPALSKMLEEAQKKVAGDDLTTIFNAIERERSQVHIDQIQFLEQFQERFSQLVARHVIEKGRRLVVFVDDLDRCLPEKAVEVLEAIKLFLDVPGCIFLLGLDQAVIARGIEIKYRELGLSAETEGQRFIIDGSRYLEKIIQLPFQIPPIERSHMADFVKGLLDEWPHPECPAVFSEGLGNKPRQVKRTVNVFLLLWQLAQRRKVGVPIRLAKVVAIQHIDPGLYDVLKRTPRLLRELEDYYRAETQALPGAEERGEERRIEPPPVLAPFVQRAPVRRLLTMHPADMAGANFSGLSSDELGLYFTLTRRAEAPQVGPAEAPRILFEPQTVPIPAGRFLMGTAEEQAKQSIAEGLDKDWVEDELPQHHLELPEYFMGKYPVTNTEYQAFVQDTDRKPPEDWDGQDYPGGKGDHPVVNVTWHDAVAYCEWLRQKTGKTYRLPTEAEWEKAARGTDGRVYPWGDDPPDEGRCNSDGTVGGTTPVDQYSPQGDSPYGCADMTGNVWEWCHTLLKSYPYDPDDGREDPKAGGIRVLRGGAFYDNRGSVRCASRHGNSPDYGGYRLGFRVVVAPGPASEL